MKSIILIAQVNSRSSGDQFGIKLTDRLSHVYLIGKTGVGKTTLLENMVIQDVVAGQGCALIDPHGDLVNRVALGVPEWRRKDLINIDVPDPNQPYSYNPLSRVSTDKRPLETTENRAMARRSVPCRMRTPQAWRFAWGETH